MANHKQNNMDIKEALLEEHSKRQALLIKNYIGKDTQRFAQLMDLFFSEEWRINQRAAYSMNFCVEAYPELVTPYLEELIYNLEKEGNHDAVKRNTVRILQNIDLPEPLLGPAADVCFRLLNNPNEAVAIRVFSMQVLYNICLKEPDLANELMLIIEEYLPYSTAGFKSRGKKILQKLDKLLK